VDDTDNVIVDSNCHKQDNAFAGVDAEICICAGDLCNVATSKKPIIISVFVMILAPIFIVLR
jgi:hypothetical protein